jgi:hypothetical protein
MHLVRDQGLSIDDAVANQPLVGFGDGSQALSLSFSWEQSWFGGLAGSSRPSPGSATTRPTSTSDGAGPQSAPASLYPTDVGHVGTLSFSVLHRHRRSAFSVSMLQTLSATPVLPANGFCSGDLTLSDTAIAFVTTQSSDSRRDKLRADSQ